MHSCDLVHMQEGAAGHQGCYVRALLASTSAAPAYKPLSPPDWLDGPEGGFLLQMTDEELLRELGLLEGDNVEVDPGLELGAFDLSGL